MSFGTLAISQFIRIPKGVDRVEGGHHAGSVGGWPGQQHSTIARGHPPTHTHTTTPIVCLWYAGLRAAAAAALEALAKSGRSTVFFDDDGDDSAEADAGKTLDLHNFAAAVWPTSCGHADPKQGSLKICACLGCIAVPQMMRPSQQLKRVPPSSSRQGLVQAAPGCPAPPEGVTTLSQPSLAATGAYGGGHVGRQPGGTSGQFQLHHTRCVLRARTACPCCADCVHPCRVATVTMSQGAGRTKQGQLLPRRSLPHQQQQQWQAAAWMQRWVQKAVVVGGDIAAQVVITVHAPQTAGCAGFLLPCVRTVFTCHLLHGLRNAAAAEQVHAGVGVKWPAGRHSHGRSGATGRSSSS